MGRGNDGGVWHTTLSVRSLADIHSRFLALTGKRKTPPRRCAEGLSEEGGANAGHDSGLFAFRSTTENGARLCVPKIPIPRAKVQVRPVPIQRFDQSRPRLMLIAPGAYG